MKLLELFDRVPTSFHEPSEDQSVLKYTDARKTRLTLRQINKLRRLDDIRRIEHDRDIARLKDIYGAAFADSNGADLGI